MREVRVLLVFLKSCFANQGTGIAVGRLHGLHALRGGELINVARLADLHSTGGPKIRSGTEFVGAETLTGADAPGALASVAERDGNGVVGMTGLNPDRAFDFLAIYLKLDNVFGLQTKTARHF